MKIAEKLFVFFFFGRALSKHEFFAAYYIACEYRTCQEWAESASGVFLNVILTFDGLLSLRALKSTRYIDKTWKLDQIPCIIEVIKYFTVGNPEYHNFFKHNTKLN